MVARAGMHGAQWGKALSCSSVGFVAWSCLARHMGRILVGSHYGCVGEDSRTRDHALRWARALEATGLVWLVLGEFNVELGTMLAWLLQAGMHAAALAPRPSGDAS